MSLTGEGRFDVSTSHIFKYPLRSPNVKSIVIEFSPDGNGNATGAVAIYLGEAMGALPWRTVAINTMRVYPSPECDFVSVVPLAGAQGICTVSLSQESLGVGIYPFSASGAGSGGAAALTPLAFGGYTNNTYFSAKQFAFVAGSFLKLSGYFQRPGTSQMFAIGIGPLGHDCYRYNIAADGNQVLLYDPDQTVNGPGNNGVVLGAQYGPGADSAVHSFEFTASVDAAGHSFVYGRSETANVAYEQDTHLNLAASPQTVIVWSSYPLPVFQVVQAASFNVT